MNFKISTGILITALILPLSTQSAGKDSEMDFSNYLRSFDYQERKDMKIDIPTLLNALHEGNVEIIDIRFPEEVAAWSMGFTKSIPLNELPDRLDELDKSKLIVTVCPHADRAAIARHYLTLQGFNSKYLVEGLMGLADHLRGDRAKEFIENK